MLRRTDSFKNELYSRLMCHEEERKNYPEYWDDVKRTLGPFILEVLNDENAIHQNTMSTKITLEDVVRQK